MNLASGLRRYAITAAIAGSSVSSAAFGQAVCWLHFDGNSSRASSHVSVNLDGIVLASVNFTSGTTDDTVRDMVVARIREYCADPSATTLFNVEPVGHTSLYLTSHDGSPFFTCEVSSNDPTLAVYDVLVTPPAMGIDLDFGSTMGGTVPDDVGPAGAGTIRVSFDHATVTAPYTAGESDQDIAHALFQNLETAGFNCWWSGASIVILGVPATASIATGLVNQPSGTDPNIAVDWTFPAFIGSMSPASVCCQSGKTITINGLGFLPTPHVLIDGVEADPLSVIVNPNTSTITCTAPNGSCAGALVDVSINNSSPRQHATRCKAFTYTDCIHIDSIFPSSGRESGGTSVTIHGDHFPISPLPAVFFGASPAQSVMVSNAQTIACVTPMGVGSVSVKVMTPQANAVVPNLFTYTSPPPTPAPIAGPAALAFLAIALVALGGWILRRSL
ncbi:MAG: IPT/TIG domain-containing protein [Planctomycetes bacterium]|nr:IPT/TIG domain-containing protein [Planctomycetota bacterium]